MTLNNPWFDYVKNGVKKYEGRMWKDIYEEIKEIEFYHHTDSSRESFSKKVINIKKYNTF